MCLAHPYLPCPWLLNHCLYLCPCHPVLLYHLLHSPSLAIAWPGIFLYSPSLAIATVRLAHTMAFPMWGPNTSGVAVPNPRMYYPIAVALVGSALCQTIGFVDSMVVVLVPLGYLVA